MDGLNPVLAALAVAVLLVLVVVFRRVVGKRQRDPVEQIRRQVQLGNYAEAGRLQLSQGNVQEAYNLFNRGRVHDLAAECAEAMGLHERAAQHAERAGDLERAAGDYLAAESFAEAARVFLRLKQARRAAEAMEKVHGVEPAYLAELWEAAHADAMPPGGREPDEAERLAMSTAAERAAQAFSRSGQLDMAIHYFELAGRVEEAQRIEQILSASPVTAQPSSAGPIPEVPPTPPAKETLSSGPKPVAAEASPSRFLPAVDETVLAATPAAGSAIPAFEHPEAMVEQPVQLTEMPLDPERLPDEVEIDIDEVVELEPLKPLPATPQPPARVRSVASVSPPAPSGDDIADSVVREIIRRHTGQVAAVGGKPVEPAVDLPSGAGRSTPPSVSRPLADWPSASVPVVDVVHIVDPATGAATPVRRETDRYRIGEHLGDGGTGAVYKARDRVLERDVALKLLPEAVAEGPLRQVFEREARAVAGLSHSGLVTVFDFGVIDQRPFISMELVEGKTVATLIQESGPYGMPILEVMAIAEELLAALGHAHQRRLVHRNIRPANVMRTADGDCKLMDLGVIGMVESARTATIAAAQAYLAPEQIVGKDVDHRTDLFAVGAALYEMLSGRHPFEGVRRAEPPASLSKLRPAVPGQLDALIRRCLAFEIEERPDSASQLLDVIRPLRRELESVMVQGPKRAVADGTASRVEGVAEPAVRSLLNKLASDAPDRTSEIRRRQAEAVFKAALLDRRSTVRAAAAEGYPGRIEGEIEARFGELLQDADESVRLAAVDRLGRSTDAAASRLLAERARQADHRTLSKEERRLLFRSLAETGGDNAVPVFAELFEGLRQSGRLTLDDPAAIDGVRAATASMEDLVDALARLDSAEALTLLRRIEIELGSGALPAVPASLDRGRGSRPAIEAPVSSSPAEILRTPQRRKTLRKSEATEEPEEPGQLPSDIEDLLVDYLSRG